MRAQALGFQQPRLDRADDFLGDFILQGKYVAEVAVKMIGPKVVLGRSVDQLGSDANAIAALADAALQHVAHTELPRGAPHIDSLAPVPE